MAFSSPVRMEPVPAASTSTSSAFLKMPLEIRRHIYELCIPQNLLFNCSFDMYGQNRGLCWFEPPWRSDKNCDRYNTSGYLNGFSFNTEGSVAEWDDGYIVSTDDDYSSCHDYDFTIREIIADVNDFKYDNKDEGSSGSSLHMQSSSNTSALPGILLICSQITDEVTTMLYGGNIFRIALHSTGERDLQTKFTSKTRKKMTKILLVLRPTGASYNIPFRMDPNVWNDTLDGLSKLWIIAEQPMPPSDQTWREIRTATENLKWTTWLISILHYLSQTMSEKVEIGVDANGEKATGNIIKSYLPNQCQFRRLPAADLIFKRGKYSLESGYWDSDDDPRSGRDIINDSDYDYYYSD